jgi:hypothetical protein
MDNNPETLSEHLQFLSERDTVSNFANHRLRFLNTNRMATDLRLPLEHNSM